MFKHCAQLLLVLPLFLAQAASAAPAHLIDAENLIQEIQPDNNSYSYDRNFIQWKAGNENGKYINNTDCSSFFNLLIEHSYSITDDQLKALTGSKRPTAARWYAAIKAGKTNALLQPLQSLGDAQPGDIIFIKYEADSKDTGHIMIIAGIPQLRIASEPLIRGTEQWAVRVIDSSKSGHGNHDTRYISAHQFLQGAGQGILRLYTTNGVISGYSWSLSATSEFKPITEHPLVLARVLSQKR